MIFVQIASYRDPELIPTVLDLVEKADNPKELRIVVAWQHDDYESLIPIKHLIEYIDIPYVDSKGVCWARNLIQSKYNNEEYTLQLDSHHRFVKGWDSILLNMYSECKNLGSELPLITTYLPNFDALTDKYINEIWQIKVDRFLDEGPLFFVPDLIKNTEILKSPIPSRFYSAHFAFSNGDLCNLVPHDPTYYFYGEETNLTVRAYTHGYDLYTPNKIIAWHQYNRKYRHTHWGDNTNNSLYPWWESDAISNKRHNELFESKISNKQIDKYSFGTCRTVKDYESYSGINFKEKTIGDIILKT
jgi:hypothetical protein